jgi:predicted  nucleic acid-binding Zn-ribbon protein
MPRIADLWVLQEIDSALDIRRGQLADAQERLGDPEELLAARARVADLREGARRAWSSQKDIEAEAEPIKAKIAAADEKLYGGSVRNPKELSDLQADVEQLKRQLSAVEDRDLEALGALESAEQELREAEATLASLEAATREEQAELNERIARLTGEVGQYEAERRDAASAIEDTVLRVYDHVRRAHQGRGVARLDRSLCTGCRITLPTTMVNKARSGQALVQCPTCERILFA